MTLKEILHLHIAGTRRYAPCRTVNYCRNCRRFTIQEYQVASGLDEYGTIPDDLLAERTISTEPYFLRCEECQLRTPAEDGSRPYLFRKTDKTVEQLLADHYPGLTERYRREVQLDWKIQNAPLALTEQDRKEWLDSVTGAAGYGCELVAGNILKSRMFMPGWPYGRIPVFFLCLVLLSRVAYPELMAWAYPEWMPEIPSGNFFAFLGLISISWLNDALLYCRRWRNYTKYDLFPRLAEALAVCPPERDVLQAALDHLCEDTMEVNKRGWRLEAHAILAQIPLVKRNTAVSSFRQIATAKDGATGVIGF